MMAVPLESFGSDGYAVVALIVLGGLAFVAGVALFGLLLVVRGRGFGRMIGAVFVVGFLALGVGPWLLAQIPAVQLTSRVEGASFWPDDLDLTGRHVMVMYSSGDCRFCTPLVTRSGAASVYLAHMDLAEWRDAGWSGLTAWALPPVGGFNLVADPEAEPAYGFADDPGLDWQAAPVPERVDVVISLEQQDFFVATQGSHAGLTWEDAQEVRWSLQVYDVPGGRIEDLAEATLAAQMMQVRPDIPKLFLPVMSDSFFRPEGARYNAVLSRWFCGADAAPDCVTFFPG